MKYFNLYYLCKNQIINPETLLNSTNIFELTVYISLIKYKNLLLLSSFFLTTKNELKNYLLFNNSRKYYLFQNIGIIIIDY